MINLTMLPLESFRRFITENMLFKPDEKILLAVSGGRDSVLLAHLFNASNFKFGIAHCNFMLRDEESDADELFTRELAAEFNVPFFLTRFKTEAYAQEHAVSIQMAARDLRYEWLEKIRQENGYAYIALAHHQNDSIETMLLNLVRGTGIAGLHGIAPKRGILIRPMLFLTRNQINEVVETENIRFREDSSNLSSKYARNKLRLDVIPRLKELNPNLEETFEANRARFSDLEIILNERVSELRETIFIVDPDHTISLRLDQLKKVNPLHTILFELLKPYHFKQPVVDDLIQSLDAQPGKIFESPTHTILIDRNKLVLEPRTGKNREIVEIQENATEGSWEKFKFVIKTADAGTYKIMGNADLSQLDAGRLIYPLKLRSWKKGDRFKPLGLGGEKKLSDFFIGLKIPASGKASVPVLENGNGDIVCIPGLRIDDRYKITPNTKKVFIFELIKPDGKQGNFY